MEIVQAEYPARKTLWRFALIGAAVGIVFTPLTVMLLLKLGIFFDDLGFETGIAFYSAIFLGFPCALVAGKWITVVRCYKNFAGIALATLLSTITGFLLSLIPLLPLLYLGVAIVVGTSPKSREFIYLFQPVPLIAALNGLITALIALPVRHYKIADDDLTDAELIELETQAGDGLLPPVLTYAEARERAAAAIKELLFTWADLQDTPPPYLSRDYMEAEGCWIFFRHERIHVSPESGPANSAIAVSKKGEVRFIADYRDNPERAKEYLQTMSEHFIRHGW
jgi:30S ribosomal protein S13